MGRAHPLKPVVEVKLDKTRHFLINFRALTQIEEATGKNVLDPTSFETMNLHDMRAMVYCALRHEDATLTEHMVGEMIGPSNIPYVMAQMSKAWQFANGAQSKPPLAVGGRSHQ